MCKEKDKFYIRVELVKMAFAESGAFGTKKILEDWELKNLYQLLDPLYHFMEEQREVIISVIDQKVNDIQENMEMIVDRFNLIMKCKDATEDKINLIRMMIKYKKQLNKEDLKHIRDESPAIDLFLKELPQHKKTYNVK